MIPFRPLHRPVDATPRADPAVSPGSSGRLPGLDGLRAIAVLLVLGYHLLPSALPGGFVGVDVFFVISGFLITTLLLRERADDGRIRLRAFWQRRARRLLPALAVLLLSCGAAAWLVGGDVLVGLGTQILGAVTFSGNWLAIAAGQSYVDAVAPELLRNLWSLAVEEQFYLLWPLLLPLLARLPARRRAAVLIVAALASAGGMAVASLAGDPGRGYFGTDTHAFGLAIGALLAFVAREWPEHPLLWPRLVRLALGAAAPVALAGMIALSFGLSASGVIAYRGGLLLASLLATVVIAAALVPGATLGRRLDIRPLRWLGERSYGLYLWHWPVWVLLTSALPSWPRTGASGWLLAGIALAVTLAAASASYALVEQPVRRHGFRAAAAGFAALWGRRRLSLATALTATLLVAGSGTATVAAILTDPGESSIEATIDEGAAAIARPAPTATPSASPAPEPAQPATGEQITAIGDSVMLAVAPELQAALPGIAIDAVVSRQMASAPDLVQAQLDAGTLRGTVVLGLGTNGPIDRDTLERVRGQLGRDRQLVLVNTQAPREWTPGVNAELAAFAERYRNVELANWHDAIGPQLQLLARDQIHAAPGGGAVYVGAVGEALRRLAELPPEPPRRQRAPQPH